jgi:hypothetical protein
MLGSSREQPHKALFSLAVRRGRLSHVADDVQFLVSPVTLSPFVETSTIVD